MAVIKNDQGETLFNISDRLHSFLLRCRDKINNEETQVLGVLWGAVGCGKSILAQKMAYVVSPTLTIDKIAFDKLEFIQAVLSSKKESIIADEGISIFFGRGAMTKEGRLIVELMNQIRQKNLFVLICVPDLLSVDSSILAQANFIGYVYEFKQKDRAGRTRIVKGNLDLFPNMKTRYMDRVIRWLKLRRGNPMFREKKPSFFLREKGQFLGEGNLFYAVPKIKYLEKKESILKKYLTEHAKEKMKKLGKTPVIYNYPQILEDLKTMNKTQICAKHHISYGQLYAFRNDPQRYIERYKLQQIVKTPDDND